MTDDAMYSVLVGILVVSRLPEYRPLVLVFADAAIMIIDGRRRTRRQARTLTVDSGFISA